MKLHALTNTLRSLLVVAGASACALPTGDEPIDEPHLGEATSAVTIDVDPHARLTGAELDQKEAQAKLVGYRPISISAYGAPGSERYAAVFVRRRGPDWKLERGTGHASFEATFAAMASAGYKPVRLSYEGAATNPVWAAVFEKTSGGMPLTRHGLWQGDGSSENHIQFWLKRAIDQGLIPSTYAIYGSASSPRYAIVLEPNPTRIAWTLGRMSFGGAGATWDGAGLLDTAAEYDARFDIHATTGARPSAVGVTGDGRYAGMFREDSVGSWVMRGQQTHAQLVAEIAAQEALGRIPIAIEAHGSATDPRFVTIFAPSDQPLARVFDARGTTAALDTPIPAVDDLIRDFMAANGVRNASLAVVADSKLVYTRGYNLTEPGTRAVSPTSYFRLASLSKTVTALEVVKLAEQGAFDLDDPIGPYLPPAWGNAAIAPRVQAITIRNLLDHTYPTLDGQCLRYEPSVSQAAADAMNVSLPLTREQSIRFTLSTPNLVEAPGDNSCYTNFAYVLLGRIVEVARGTSFEEAVWEDLLIPSAIGRFRPAVQTPMKDEAGYRTPFLSTRPSINVDGAPLTSSPYGGDINPAVSLSSGAMSMPATDLARLLTVASQPAPNNVFANPASFDEMLAQGLGFDGNVMAGGTATKGGLLAGMQGVISWDRDGISYVLLIARNGLPMQPWFPRWTALVTALEDASVQARPDLFPQFNMPSL